MTICFARLPCIVNTVPAWINSRCRPLCLSAPCLTWIQRRQVLDQTWLTDCWSCCLFPLTALSAPSAQLFCPPQVHPKILSTDAAQYTAARDQVALLRITRSDSEGNLTLSCPHLSSQLLVSLPCLSLPHLCSSPLLSSRWLHTDSWAREQSDCLAVSSGAGAPLALPFLAVMGTLPLWLSFLQGSGKKAPPAAQLMRVKQPGSHSAVKREKRFSTSSFPLSANRELQKLRALAGTLPLEKRSNQSFLWMQPIYISLGPRLIPLQNAR